MGVLTWITWICQNCKIQLFQFEALLILDRAHRQQLLCSVSWTLLFCVSACINTHKGFFFCNPKPFSSKILGWSSCEISLYKICWFWINFNHFIYCSCWHILKYHTHSRCSKPQLVSVMWNIGIKTGKVWTVLSICSKTLRNLSIPSSGKSWIAKCSSTNTHSCSGGGAAAVQKLITFYHCLILLQQTTASCAFEMWLCVRRVPSRSGIRALDW